VLRSQRSQRFHRELEAVGNWDDSLLVTLRCVPGKPRSPAWIESRWRDTVEQVHESTGKRCDWALVTNRGKSGKEAHASGHLVWGEPVDRELLAAFRRVWCAKHGKWEQTAGGDRATTYWANNRAQRGAEAVYSMCPVWRQERKRRRKGKDSDYAPDRADDDENLGGNRKPRVPFKQTFPSTKAAERPSK
jgi:hypothetical protein